MFNLSKKIIYFEEIDSTQKEVWKRINENEIDESIVVITKRQKNGIGTHGRKWINESDDNILFSVGIDFENIDKNLVTINDLNGITIEIANILLRVFKDTYGIENIIIKNPNDLILNGKKIGGILTETKLQGMNLKKLVLGIGINTNQKEFKNEQIRDVATSINKELNIKFDNDLIIKIFLKYFEEILNKRVGK